MDARTWPLSVAATQRLLDLRTDRRTVSSEFALLTLCAKELVLRGAIHTDEVIKKRRDSKLMVSTRLASGALPAAPALLLSRLERAHRMELRRLMRNAVRKHRQLRAEIANAARGELVARGLITQGERRVLGVFPHRFDVLSPSGEAWQRAARAIVERGEELAMVARKAPPRPDEVDALGPLILLVARGMSLGARASAQARLEDRTSERESQGASESQGEARNARLRRRTAGATAGYAPPAIYPGDALASDVTLDGYDDGAEPFSVLDGLGDAFAGVLDDALSGLGASLDAGLDSAFDSLDSAFDAVDSAIGSMDSAIDSGFSDGGGFGGGDGGGGGGDGGGS